MFIWHLVTSVINWTEDGASIEKPAKFWGFVRKYERGGSLVFEELGNHARNVMCIPVSTAFVERIFSIVKYMKNSYRNKMNTSTLDSLLTLKCHLQENLNIILDILLVGYWDKEV